MMMICPKGVWFDSAAPCSKKAAVIASLQAAGAVSSAEPLLDIRLSSAAGTGFRCC